MLSWVRAVQGQGRVRAEGGADGPYLLRQNGGQHCARLVSVGWVSSFSSSTFWGVRHRFLFWWGFPGSCG